MNKLDLIDRRDPIAVNTGSDMIVIACDSCGSIGNKPNDALKVPVELVGRVTLRVPLFEVLSLGANPISVSIVISNEPDDTGNRILDGVKAELIEILGYVPPMVISTEKNMPTSMTGLGVTVIGTFKGVEPQLCENPFNHQGFLVGIPSVGEEVILNKDKILSKNQLDKIIDMKEVLEVIPCGSSGVVGELLSVLEFMKFKGNSSENFEVEISKAKGIIDRISEEQMYLKSCGPSTAAIVIACEDITGFGLENMIKIW